MSTDEEQLTDMNQTTLESHESQLQQLREECAAMESRVPDQLMMMESDNKQRLDVLQGDMPTSQQLEAVKHQMAALHQLEAIFTAVLIILLAINLSQIDLTRWNPFNVGCCIFSKTWGRVYLGVGNLDSWTCGTFS